MKTEQTVYKCNKCFKTQTHEHGSYGGCSPFNIEVRYPSRSMSGYHMVSLDFCSPKCLKEYAEQMEKKENKNEI